MAYVMTYVAAVPTGKRADYERVSAIAAAVLALGGCAVGRAGGKAEAQGRSEARHGRENIYVLGNELTGLGDEY